MSFLKGEWRKLAIANYVIDQDKLKDYIPFGTELDLWNGKCFISLVGFMFKNTKLFGVKIPFHVDYEQVNLRFYVKRFEKGEWKRGVVFIKEIVPKMALTFVANTIYNENYETMPMTHHYSEGDNKRVIEYKWKKSGIENSFKIQASLEKYEIQPNSETEFITEHYWGYAKVNEEKSNEYEVTHPKWDVYKVEDYEINVDFGAVYDKDFEFLNSMKPHSVILAEGSEITVENKKVIKKTTTAHLVYGKFFAHNPDNNLPTSEKAHKKTIELNSWKKKQKTANIASAIWRLTFKIPFNIFILNVGKNCRYLPLNFKPIVP